MGCVMDDGAFIACSAKETMFKNKNKQLPYVASVGYRKR